MKKGAKRKAKAKMRAAKEHEHITHDHTAHEHEAQHHHAPKQSKKKLFITIAIIVILAVGLLLLLMGKGESNVKKTIVVKVNGEPIYQEDVAKLLEQATQQGFPLTEQQVTEQLITRQVLLQEAKKNKITIEESAIDKYITDLEGLIGQPIEPLYAKMGLTKEEFRQQIKEQLIITQLLTEKVPAPTTISDQEIKEFYDANEEYFVTPDQVDASHILLKTEDEAKEVLKRLKDGEDFGTVAKEKSIDPSAKTNNGNLGFFGKGQMVPEFEDAAFNLEIGEFSEPVKSQFGYHIIVVHEKKKAEKLSLEQAKENIHKAILDQKNKEQSTTYAQELVSKAKVEKFTVEEKK